MTKYNVQDLLVINFRVICVRSSGFRYARRRADNVRPRPFAEQRGATSRIVLPFLRQLSSGERSPGVNGRFFNVTRYRVARRALIVLVGVVTCSYFLAFYVVRSEFLRTFRCLLRCQVIGSRLLTIRRYLRVNFNRRLSNFRSGTINANLGCIRPWLLVRCFSHRCRRVCSQVALRSVPTSIRPSYNQASRSRIRRGGVQRTNFGRYPRLLLDRDDACCLHVKGFVTRGLFHPFRLRLSVFGSSCFGFFIFRVSFFQ